MPRPKSLDRAAIAEQAMGHFWREGFHAASISTLIAATGLNRKALYDEFDGKAGLFAAALAAYIDAVVTPAFAAVEAPDAGLAAIDRFFTIQIARGVAAGLPGPGCFIANTMTECAAAEPTFAGIIDGHLARLTAGFANALANEAAARGADDVDIAALAEFLTISAQGLWAYSRRVSDAQALATYKENLVAMIDERLSK